MAKLGFVGLGLMGSRIVKRLLDAGHEVYGYNRTRAKAESLIQAGMRWKNSPKEVAEAADITLSMVADTAALSSITDGDKGILAGLSTGKIYADMSTVSPETTRLIARRVADSGAEMLDAPVSGSVSAVEAGNLIIYVGGNKEALEKVRPIFEQLSQKVIYVGESGQAVSMKIAINLNIAPQLISLFEGVLLAERSGIPRVEALDGLLSSVAASTAMKYRAPFVLKMPEEVWFSAAMMKKDIQLALDLGKELGVTLKTAELANEMLTQAIEMGWGDEDFAVLFKVVEQLSPKKEA
ncbi:MAG: NAD(P)-dependent oxidoreductase [Anaerolineales bacterium]|nr:NAD(P)-dependent oxidoreductase [Anaerolineales bacterium]MBX3035921.1 NAD(P)-dependent oxidoreductase [Anaerolineales bacterium]